VIQNVSLRYLYIERYKDISQMKRLILLFIITLSMAIPVIAEGTTGKTLDTLNLRVDPSLGDNVLTRIPIGTTVIIQGRNNTGGWLFITANGTSGWVSSRYIDWDGVALGDIPIIGTTTSASIPQTVAQPEVVIAGNAISVTSKARLNVRSEPSTSGTIMTTLNFNQTVSAIGHSNDGEWLAVDTGNVRGWVSSDYVYYAGDINSLTVNDGLSNNNVVPVNDIPTTQTPVTSNGQYVITGAAPNNSTSYDMEFTLHWNTTANLDLRVTGPDGYTIVPGVPPSPTGGYFQQAIGANENCRTAEGAALEVITWDKGTAPSGLYQIQAEHVNDCFPEQEEETLFWVSVKNDGPEVEFWVYFIEPGELFEFEFVRP
jgi:uncharacterized protein YraI